MAHRVVPPTGNDPSAPRRGDFWIISHYKDFRYLWIGNFFTVGAQWIQILTVGWLVLQLTDGNAFLTGTAVGIRTSPVLLIGPWAGVLADRADRRKLVMVTPVYMAISSVIFALKVLTTNLDVQPVTGFLRWWHPFIYIYIYIWESRESHIQSSNRSDRRWSPTPCPSETWAKRLPSRGWPSQHAYRRAGHRRVADSHLGVQLELLYRGGVLRNHRIDLPAHETALPGRTADHQRFFTVQYERGLLLCRNRTDHLAINRDGVHTKLGVSVCGVRTAHFHD